MCSSNSSVRLSEVKQKLKDIDLMPVSPHSSTSLIEPRRLQSTLHVCNTEVKAIVARIYYSHYLNIWNDEKIRTFGFTHLIYITKNTNSCRYDLRSQNHISNEIEILYINFIENPFIITNCAKSTKFIDNALNETHHSILIIDTNGVDTCILLVMAYLMKTRKCTWLDAYKHLKAMHPQIVLDFWHANQLTEYATIANTTIQRKSTGVLCDATIRISSSPYKRQINEDEIKNKRILKITY